MTARPLKILFVCYGNICRSPMAVGIARALYGEDVDGASAGIAPVGDRPSEEAVIVVQTRYGIDIRGHRPRSLAEVEAAAFDYVIAMDLYVYERIREAAAVPEDRLYAWDVDDPLGRGVEAYFGAAAKIQDRLEQFLASRAVAG
jgi:protein-tyrosine-phosphatase